MVGPGVKNTGVVNKIFSDHTDIRPTMLLLTKLTDDYSHDGRVLFEVLNSNRLPSSIASQKPLFGKLVNTFKAINAPVGQLGLSALKLSTSGVLSSNAAYGAIEKQLSQIGGRRDSIANHREFRIPFR